MIKNCLFCKNKFNAIHSYNKFCSVACYGLSERGSNNPGWRGGKVSAVCLNCLKPFSFQRKKHMKGMYCSRRCVSEGARVRGIYKKEKNPSWRGGTLPLSGLLRRSPENQAWRKAIFERDNYTCQKCSVRGGYLEADHYPIAFSQLLQHSKDTMDFSAFWNTNNGRTLCRPCHDKTKTGRPVTV